MLRFVVVLVLVFAVISDQGKARVWYVEKDGSGDFLEIQPAVDVAASGDTIQIGPGRFDQLATSNCDRIVVDIYISPTQENLVILGSGNDQTIVGPVAPWDPYMPPVVGIGVAGFCGNRNLIVKGIRFENMGHGIHCEFASFKDGGTGTSLSVDSCVFYGTKTGIFSDGDTILVSNCADFSSIFGAIFFSTYLGAPVQNIEIRNCTSELTGVRTMHIASGILDSMYVVDCDFSGDSTDTGIGVASSAEFLYLRNVIISSGSRGVEFYGNELVIDDCTFAELKTGIWIRDANVYMEVDSTTFSEMIESSIAYNEINQGGHVHNSVLDKGEQYAVAIDPWLKSGNGIPAESLGLAPPMWLLPNSSPVPWSPKMFKVASNHLDMTNNYWGTDDPDSIQAWIEDGNDDPDWPYYIDWNPYKSDEVSTEKKSMGNVKSMYR